MYTNNQIFDFNTPEYGCLKIFCLIAECDGLIRVHNQHVAEQSKQDPILCFDSVSTLRKHLRNVGRKTLVTPRDFTQGIVD